MLYLKKSQKKLQYIIRKSVNEMNNNQNSIFMKILFSTICIMLCSFTLMAKPKVPQFVREKANVVVNIDFSQATWEKKQSFKDWCGDAYDERVSISNESFKKSLGKEYKSLTVVGSKADAKYEINVYVDNLKRKTEMNGEYEFKIYGKIDVVDVKSGKIVYTYKAKGVDGGDDYNEDVCLAKVFDELADEMVD